MPKTVYRFRSYQLDPRQRELWRDGERVALPLKSFDCLVYLVEHRDRAVGRDELIAAVWGRADINDHTLAQTLSRVRQSLRDGEAETIRTMPRFGYRWIVPTERIELDSDAEAPVVREAPTEAVPTEAEPASAPLPHVAVPSHDTPPSRRGFPWPAALGVAALAASLGVVYVLHLRSMGQPPAAVAAVEPASAPASGDGTYLVMPVLVEAPPADVAWMRLGLMDYIGVALKEGGERRVLPNDQILSLTAHSKPSGQLESAELSRLTALTGATHVVQAHARKTDAGWRVAIDLFRGDTLRSYAGTAPAPLEAVHAALEPMMRDLHLAGRLAPLSSHDETLQRIDEALLTGDLAQAQQLLDADPALLAESAEFRLRSGQLASRRGRLDPARQMFRALIDDPSPAARALLPQAWLGLGNSELQRPDFPAAEAAFSEAIALLSGGGSDQQLGAAYAGRGASYSSRERFEEAMADFGRARIALERAGDRIGIAKLEINIAAADAYRGRLAQALEAQDRSIRVLTAFGARELLLTPLHNKVYVQFGLLDFTGALETSRRAFELAQPLDNERVKTRIAAAHTRALLNVGQLAEAGRMFDRYAGAAATRVDPEFVLMQLEWLAQKGEYARAADLAADSLERAAASEGFAALDMVSWTCFAGVDAALRVHRPELAERLIERVAQASKEPLNPEQSTLLDFSRAQLLQASGRHAEARALFSSALASAERVGEPAAIVAFASLWLRHLIEQRDFEAAAPLAGRLKSYAEKDYAAARALEAYYRASGQSALAGEAAAQVRALAGERDPRLPL